MPANTEIAWAAGFWDGEGCWSQKKEQGGYAYPFAQLNNTSEEVVRRFHAAVGVGKVYGPYTYKGKRSHHKPFWRWQAYGDVGREALDKLLPFLSAEKREQYEGVMPS